MKLADFVASLIEQKETAGVYLLHLATKDVPLTLKLKKRGQKITVTIDTEKHGSCLLLDVACSEPDASTTNVRHLGSCQFLTGNELLEVVDFINPALLSKICTLDDEATIDLCGQRTNFAVFRLLTTGKTWYQTHGFVPKPGLELMADFEDDPSEANFTALLVDSQKTSKKAEKALAEILDAAPSPAALEEKELGPFLRAFSTNRAVFAFLAPLLLLQKQDEKACAFYTAYEAFLGQKVYTLHAKFTLHVVKYY